MAKPLMRVAKPLTPGVAWSAEVRQGKRVIAACAHRHRESASALECATAMRNRVERRRES
jgi:hypothetical protein